MSDPWLSTSVHPALQHAADPAWPRLSLAAVVAAAPAPLRRTGEWLRGPAALLALLGVLLAALL